ncbi:hypothetical protein BSLA_02r2485 [Burkholderia stabilis]|nr:hypothetical protein BSLA_02r2485 [Burkholderia stabilis]
MSRAPVGGGPKSAGFRPPGVRERSSAPVSLTSFKLRAFAPTSTRARQTGQHAAYPHHRRRRKQKVTDHTR